MLVIPSWWLRNAAEKLDGVAGKGNPQISHKNNSIFSLSLVACNIITIILIKAAVLHPCICYCTWLVGLHIPYLMSDRQLQVPEVCPLSCKNPELEPEGCKQNKKIISKRRDYQWCVAAFWQDWWGWAYCHCGFNLHPVWTSFSFSFNCFIFSPIWLFVYHIGCKKKWVGASVICPCHCKLCLLCLLSWKKCQLGNQNSLATNLTKRKEKSHSSLGSHLVIQDAWQHNNTHAILLFSY